MCYFSHSHRNILSILSEIIFFHCSYGEELARLDMAKVEAKKALDVARKSGVARAVQDDIKVDLTLLYSYNTITKDLMHTVLI